MPIAIHIDRSQIQGVVLCGGRSTRFGSSKAHYDLEGQTLVERAARIALPLVDELVLAIGDSSAAEWPEMRVIRDRVLNIGPMGGIHAAMHEMRHDWLLVLPTDVPYMTTAVLRTLIEEAQDGDSAVVAVDGRGRLHPLCGLYHRSIGSELDAAVIRKEYSLTRLLCEMSNVRYVTFRDEHLRNVNRKEDLH